MGHLLLWTRHQVLLKTSHGSDMLRKVEEIHCAKVGLGFDNMDCIMGTSRPLTTSKKGDSGKQVRLSSLYHQGLLSRNTLQYLLDEALDIARRYTLGLLGTAFDSIAV